MNKKLSKFYIALSIVPLLLLIRNVVLFYTTDMANDLKKLDLSNLSLLALFVVCLTISFKLWRMK